MVKSILNKCLIFLSMFGLLFLLVGFYISCLPKSRILVASRRQLGTLRRPNGVGDLLASNKSRVSTELRQYGILPKFFTSELPSEWHLIPRDPKREV
jgi:hypothetical protein